MVEFQQAGQETKIRKDTDPLITQGPLAVRLLGSAACLLSTHQERRAYAYPPNGVITYLSLVSLYNYDTLLTLYRIDKPRRSPSREFSYNRSVSITWLDQAAEEVGLMHFIYRPDLYGKSYQVVEQSAVWSYADTNDRCLWHRSGGVDIFVGGNLSAEEPHLRTVESILAEREMHANGMDTITNHLIRTHRGLSIMPFA